MKKEKYDIAIIGAGIVGLAHAWEAHSRGLSVVILERNQFALGASIRNFGLVWPIGQKGSLFERAMRSRSTWIDLSERVGFSLQKSGSLHLAYDPLEFRVLEEFFSANGSSAYDLELLPGQEVVQQHSHINESGLIGGLLSKTELTVDPREAIRKIADYLGSLPEVDIQYGQTVLGIDGTTVRMFDRQVEAERVIVCSGADFETLYPSHLRESGLKKCKLQMMRTYPVEIDLGPSLCAGLTLKHYDAFSNCPSLEHLVTKLDQDYSEYGRHGIHVLLSQNASGELIIGDSHEYGDDLYPFDQVEIDELVLTYLRSFFKAPFSIKERWHGIYPKLMNGEADLVIQPESNVWIVNGLSGAGMTLSFGLAEDNFNKYFS